MVNKKIDKTKPKQRKKAGNPNWKKGVSANPNGRPKGSGYMDALNKAIHEVEKIKKKKLFIRFVEQAYNNPTIMVALMNKLIANKQYTEIEGVEPIEFIIKHIGNAKDKT